MKPIDLKEIAQRFTSKYYPQWISRVDKIWDMFGKIDLNQILSESTASQYQLGDAFGIAGATEPEFNECISGIAILAFTYKNVKDEDDINEKDVKKQISILPVNPKITAALQQKIEDVLSEMLSSNIDGVIENKKDTGIQKPKCSDEGKFVVYLARPTGFGSDKFFANEEKLHAEYLLDKEQYDIIIYHQNVEVKSMMDKKIEFEPVEMYANILNLLILFLKYKDKNIPFIPLYHCAWKGSGMHEERDSKEDEMIDSLKHAVSTLRKLKNKVKDFNIPNAKRGKSTYTCKGNFNFCLVLEKSDDQRYTLEVD